MKDNPPAFSLERSLGMIVSHVRLHVGHSRCEILHLILIIRRAGTRERCLDAKADLINGRWS